MLITSYSLISLSIIRNSKASIGSNTTLIAQIFPFSLKVFLISYLYKGKNTK